MLCLPMTEGLRHAIAQSNVNMADQQANQQMLPLRIEAGGSRKKDVVIQWVRTLCTFTKKLLNAV